MPATEEIAIPIDRECLYGNLDIPSRCQGLVIFAHGSGSSRHSPRNRQVAEYLREAGLGTLLFDLLTSAEERVDVVTAEYRFDIELLAARLVTATRWLAESHTRGIPLAYFGSSTGAAAALIAAAESREPIAAVVSRGGRPDLAERALSRVTSPTLLIVGGRDPEVLALNERALALLDCEKRLVVIDGATHLFEEPGTLESVCMEARLWFLGHLASVAET
jgi:putative phosphoribosyl transferase